MKLGQKIILFVAISILTIGLFSSTFAASDRNKITLTEDDGVVHIYIETKEATSIASFQIGLSIKNSNSHEFEWNENLLSKVGLSEYTVDEDDETLYLYYVGVNELNNVDNKFEVGTITFDYSDISKVTITPIEDSTIASSINHKRIEFTVNSSDTLSLSGSKSSGSGSSSKKTEKTELKVENYMKENKELDSLAVNLRSNLKDSRANQNVFAIGDKVIYYVEYKNGGKDIDNKVTLELKLPLGFTVSKSDGASMSKAKGTLTWNFKNMKAGAADTKTVELVYTGLKGSDDYSTEIVTATISNNGTVKDTSSVAHMIIKDYNVDLDDSHEPYMKGDSEGNTFRPDSTMTRGEAAIVLTRIFGINTNFTDDTLAFPDLANTYPEARNAVRAAVQNGLVTGYPDGTYKPDASMTKAEFMAILARQVEREYKDGFEIKDLDDLIKIYKDTDNTGYLATAEHWGVVYATLLARLNMTPLTSKNTTISLDSAITRAEVAQLVNYYLFRAPATSSNVTSSKFVDVPSSHKLLGDILEATREKHELNVSDNGYEN